MTRRHMCTFSHLLLSAAGLALICGGTYLISAQEQLKYRAFIACAIMFGLSAALVFTHFWTSYKVKRQQYKMVRQQHIQVYAITRPDSFPPSYEESECHKDTAAGADVPVSPPAPPLYSQDSWEAPGCTRSWEQPPPYTQAGRVPQQDAL